MLKNIFHVPCFLNVTLLLYVAKFSQPAISQRVPLCELGLLKVLPVKRGLFLALLLVKCHALGY